MNAVHPTDVWQGAGRRVFFNEVGTRDGLQMEQAFVPTEDKIALVNALSQAGLSKICLLYTSPSPRDKRQSRMPSSA